MSQPKTFKLGILVRLTLNCAESQLDLSLVKLSQKYANYQRIQAEFKFLGSILREQIVEA